MFKDAYNKALKRYDRDLFCDHNRDGVLCVFRKHKRFVPVCVSEGFKILNLITDKQFIFALTENWSLSTPPRVWGVDHVLTRIRQIDCQANERYFEELEAQEKRVDESEKRHLRNEAEAFVADNRREFTKWFDDEFGCVHSLSKDEPRKRLKDRRIKNGNY